MFSPTVKFSLFDSNCVNFPGAWSPTDWATLPGRSARSWAPWQPAAAAADPGVSVPAKKTTHAGTSAGWKNTSGV